jgi:hypothetical protein
MKLYKNALRPNYWVAHLPGTGWMAFPARPNGWDDRHPARGLDPLHLREVPRKMAAETGLLEALAAEELVGA